MTDSETVLERRIPLAGAANFRDLGGYPTQDGRRVRWRRLFRSDRLAELSPADVDVLRELGITTVFDLRTADELDRHGTSPLYEHGVIHRHVPFVEKVGNTAGAEATEGRRASSVARTCTSSKWSVHTPPSARCSPRSRSRITTRRSSTARPARTAPA